MPHVNGFSKFYPCLGEIDFVLLGIRSHDMMKSTLNQLEPHLDFSYFSIAILVSFDIIPALTHNSPRMTFPVYEDSELFITAKVR